ncbi:FAD:protein FMN transferase [Variovorax guangxiensis]|uniref:FAD:protein FMN transferase n=1 Tax=Variovorax guangxiensis TaxID=1775474 RepID=A0A502DRL7_9BURK|nr:FAD:protein FMN transferase [Variovorax guangxiensis]TPG23429.1 FAD:protein FMN transferase [Variovorax ginsengisoli]TPG27977.1 FAD:protein FMN transferase [Variovorax guangxiensis]
MRPSFATWRAGGYANAVVPRAADPARLQTLAGRTMGTSWSLKFDNPAMLPHATVQAAVTQALDRVIAQMSTWEPDSDIGRYNNAQPGSRHALPSAFAEVLACALHWAEASDGAIDPTVGPLVALWGFGAHADPALSPPSPAALTAARERVGWRRLAFDPATGRITQQGGLWLDLSGIAKGFAVDHVADALQAIGLRDFLVEIGGELKGCGQRTGGHPWRVRLDTLIDTLPPLSLCDLAVATSGDRWHAHEQAGRRWSHTIDPRSGEPAAPDLSSVTVLHPQCMHADALATTLAVLGAAEGLAFAQRHDIAALFVSRDVAGPRAIASHAWQVRTA